MNDQDKTKEQLINGLEELQEEISSLKVKYANDIAGCLHLNESMQIEMENLGAIFESSPASMMVLDEKTTIIRANKAAIILTGGNEASTLQNRPGNALGCVHSSDDPRGCGYSQACLLCPARNGIEYLLEKGGSIQGAEISLILIRNGEPQNVWLEMSAENIQINGQRHLCVVMKDITSRKQMEGQLILSEQKFRTSFDQSPVGSVIVGLDKHFISCNSAFCNFLGYTENELIGKTISDVTYPEDSEIGMKEIKQLVAREISSSTNQKRYLRKDGKIVWGEITISLIRDENNSPMFFLPIIQDITQQKHAADELHKKDALLNITGQTAKVGGWEFDTETMKQTWTDEVFKIHELETTFDPNVGNGINFYAPESRPVIENAVDRAIQFGEPFDLKLKFITNKGNHRWVHSIGKAYQVNGKTKRVVGSIQDITDHQQAEETIKLQNEELIKMNASKDKFFSIIAHDLKTPFNSILGFSEHLIDQINEKNYEQIAEFAGIIRQSSIRVMDLLMNLIEWAQAQSGRIEFKPEYFEINTIISEVILLMKGNADQKAIIITNKLSSGIQVYADKAMLSTVLRNLISNAIKFTKPEGRITILAEEKQNEITVSISDNGVGLSKERIDKLFEITEKYSTSGTQNEKGTGLGLILCKEFIEKNNGKIWVESEVGIGTTFYFSIPIKP